MNIFEMLDWIRKNDVSTGGKFIFTASFFHDRHLRGLLSSEDLFYGLKDIMKLVIDDAEYIHHSQFPPDIQQR